MKRKVDPKEQHTNQLEKGHNTADEMSYSKNASNELDNMPRIQWNSRDMFGRLLENVPDMIFMADLKGNMLYTNKAFRDFTDYLLGEAKPVNIFELAHNGDLIDIKQRFSEIVEGNFIGDFEFKFRTRYGSYIDVQFSLSPVLESDVKVVAVFCIGRDVTKHRQVIENLKESEELYRTIVDNSPDIMFTTDIEGRILSINKVSGLLYGFDYEDMIGKFFTDFIREEALPQILKDYKQVINGNKVVNESVVVGKDGKERNVVTVVLPIMKNGIITKIQGIVKDVTDYKRAEEKLRRIFDSVTDGVIVTDLEGNITELNDKALDLHGYDSRFDSKDKLLGQRAFDLVPSYYREKVIKSINKTIKQGLIKNIEYKILRQDGSELWGELSASVLKDAFGKPIGIIGIVRDISERKYSEELLHRSQEKLRSIIKAMPDSIFHIDRSGTIIDEPMGYNRMVGLYRSALPGKLLYDVFPYEFANKAMRAINKTLESNTLQIMEYTWVFPPGNNAIYEIRVVPCGEDEVIAIVRDTTDQKQYQERLLTYQQYLKSLTSQLSQAEERERRRLAEGLHDLIGQPLAVVKMKLKAWDYALYPSGQSSIMKDVLELLEDAIQNTRSLTFDLSPPVLYELGLEAGLEFLLEQFQERYGMCYKYEDDGQEKPLEGKVSILLYRCASELLMNIVKHAEAQLVKLSVAREDNHVLITIDDDGVGFTVSEKEVGSKRFGLFSIHERLNWINGSFTIQSKPGSGTRAILKAPLEKIENSVRSY